MTEVIVVLEQKCEGLAGLIFQFQPVHQKQHAPGVAGAQEQFDDGGGGQRLAGAGRHFEQEAALVLLDGLLNRVHCPLLVFAQEAQVVLLDKGAALGLVLPARFAGVAGHLG